MYKFFIHLFRIKESENGKTDQHEASFKIGKLLKELYIDSALKQAEKHDAKQKKRPPRKEEDLLGSIQKMNTESNNLYK